MCICFLSIRFAGLDRYLLREVFEVNRAPISVKLILLLIHILDLLRLNCLNLVLVVTRARLIDKVARNLTRTCHLELLTPTCGRILLLRQFLRGVIVTRAKWPREKLVIGVVELSLIGISVFVTCVIGRPFRRANNIVCLTSPALTRGLSISLAI